MTACNDLAEIIKGRGRFSVNTTSLLIYHEMTALHVVCLPQYLDKRLALQAVKALDMDLTSHLSSSEVDASKRTVLMAACT